MKFSAGIYAPVEKNWLGLPSRVLEDLGNKPVIAWIVAKVLSLDEIDQVVLVTDQAGCVKLKELFDDPSVMVIEAAPAPTGAEGAECACFVAGRKWGLETWQGGVANTYVYYEEGQAADWLRVLEETGTHAMVKISGSAPFVDTGLISQQIDFFSNVLTRSSLCITPAPPGWNYEVWIKSALEEEIKCHGGLRNTLMFRPDISSYDPLAQPFMFPLDETLLCTRARLCADTQKGWRLIRGLWDAYGESLMQLDAVQIVQRLKQHPKLQEASLPLDVEIEVCGTSQLDPIFSPMKGIQRPMMEMGLFKKVIDELAACDDVLLTIGGYGEPFLHPDIMEMVCYAKERGILGIHVATNGILLHDEIAKGLMDIPIDVISVGIHTVNSEGYQAVNNGDFFDQVHDNLHACLTMQDARGVRTPHLVPEIVKMDLTEEHIEAFFDFWYSRTGWVGIRGFNTYGGLLEDRSIVHLNCAARAPCMRLSERLMIFADGKVPYCSQDVRLQHVIGDLNRDSIQDLWQGDVLQDLRLAHREGDYGKGPLCAECLEWDHL